MAAATITTDAGWAVVDALRAEVADLLDELSAEQRRRPSLCDAWTVRDVGAHLSLAALAPRRMVASTALRSGLRFDAMIREGTLAWSRTLSDPEVSANLRALVGNRRLAPTTRWRDPLIDVLVHSQDVARPLGATMTTHPEAAVTAADWAWDRTFGFPFMARRRLLGLRLVATDAEWIRGSGDEVRGPVTSLLLLSTGRRTAYAELSGPGAERARTLVHA